jgi:hypothetical protein
MVTARLLPLSQLTATVPIPEPDETSSLLIKSTLEQPRGFDAVACL